MSTDWLKEMQKKAQDIKSKESSGLDFLKQINLTGKNAVVKGGGSFVVRLLPRWDYKNAFILKAGKWTKNPDWVSGGYPYYEAFEHWWDGDGGKKNRIWCPVTLDKTGNPHLICAVCKDADKLRGSSDETDRKHGNSIHRKEVFLFNAVLQDPKTKLRSMTDEGKPDIRILPAHNTVFVGISAIMGGDGQDEFARGDITKVKEGYDVLLTRPVQGGGERWKVTCASKSTPLLKTKQEVTAWGYWPELLTNLEKFVSNDMKTAEDIHKLYHGTEMKTTSETTKPKAKEEGPGEPEPAGDLAEENTGDETEEAPWGMEFE